MTAETHPTALVETAALGGGCRIGAFCRLLAGSRLGDGCELGDHVFVDAGVVAGAGTVLRNGAQLWAGAVLGERVSVGANVVVGEAGGAPVVIEDGVSLGAAVVVAPGIRICRHAVVEPGTILLRDVPPYAIVTGHPARIVGYVTDGAPDRAAAPQQGAEERTSLVEGVGVVRLPRIVDLRGSLTFGEYDRHLPFVPKRYFVIFGVPTAEVRGEHAHKEAHQFLVCLSGTCSVVLDDGLHREEIELSHPDVGIHLPPMVWGIQYKFSSDAILLVLASDVYDADDYIRDYPQYLAAVAESRARRGAAR